MVAEFDSNSVLEEGSRSLSDCKKVTSSDQWKHSNNFSRLLGMYSQIAAILWLICLYL